jgi:hypothetical protein
MPEGRLRPRELAPIDEFGLSAAAMAGKRGGPPVTPPGRKGFGSRLIEGGLAQELDGEVRLDYEPAGVVCQIIMPVGREVWMSHE